MGYGEGSGFPVLDFREWCRVEQRAKHPKGLAAEGGGPNVLGVDALLQGYLAHKKPPHLSTLQ